MLANNLGSILIAIVIFLSQFVFNDSQQTIKQLEEQVSKLTVQVATLTAQMQSLTNSVKAAADDRYTGSVANAINQNLQRQIDDNGKRISKLEAKY